MKQISILGCGWLGLPLAKSLVEKGFLVKGSTTSIEKLVILKECGIEPHIIFLSAVEEFKDDKIDSFLENSEILIIDIPPKLRGDSTENFVGKIQNLLPFIEKSSVKKVIFVSSTSVYSDSSSIDNITEETKPNPDTESGKQLLEAELLLLCNSNFKTIILRFGGLIGEDRHPIKFLAGRKNIENPNAPINMIHQTDCIGIIEAILQKAQNDKLECNETFNAVAPYHPKRKEYYHQKAQELNLVLPEFDESKVSLGKMILSTKIESFLNYTFKNRTL